jgi:hypothetical protein
MDLHVSYYHEIKNVAESSLFLADGKVVFNDYKARAAAGNFIKRVS